MKMGIKSGPSYAHPILTQFTLLFSRFVSKLADSTESINAASDLSPFLEIPELNLIKTTEILGNMGTNVFNGGVLI